MDGEQILLTNTNQYLGMALSEAYQQTANFKTREETFLDTSSMCESVAKGSHWHACRVASGSPNLGHKRQVRRFWTGLEVAGLIIRARSQIFKPS